MNLEDPPPQKSGTSAHVGAGLSAYRAHGLATLQAMEARIVPIFCPMKTCCRCCRWVWVSHGITIFGFFGVQSNMLDFAGLCKKNCGPDFFLGKA